MQCSCGQELAASAETCPKCGRRFTTPTTMILGGIIALILLVLIMAVWLNGG